MLTPDFQREQLLKVEQVADWLNADPSHVRKLVHAGRLRAHDIGLGEERARGLRIPESSVQALLTETEVKA